MIPSIDLNDPVAVLLAALQVLDQAGIEAATYGGLALAVYGEPRETKDADLAVAGLRGADAEAAFRAAGFDVILAFDSMRFGGQFVSRLRLIGGMAGSLNTADLIEPRSLRYGRQVLARSLTAPLRDQALRVVSPEDFIVLKILATRERDLEDALTVMRALSSRLDMDLIERELGLLATEISDYDFMTRWRRAKRALDSLPDMSVS